MRSWKTSWWKKGARYRSFRFLRCEKLSIQVEMVLTSLLYPVDGISNGCCIVSYSCAIYCLPNYRWQIPCKKSSQKYRDACFSWKRWVTDFWRDAEETETCELDTVLHYLQSLPLTGILLTCSGSARSLSWTSSSDSFPRYCLLKEIKENATKVIQLRKKSEKTRKTWREEEVPREIRWRTKRNHGERGRKRERRRHKF